ncbi:MAG TPA: tetratricopeptide repeat protein [Steroidobacteraceae bacterium]
MDDYLTESDQWERVKTFVRENGIAMIVGVLLGAGILYGYSWWSDHVTARSQAAAARYLDVLDALGRNDKARAIELTQQLQKDYAATPYVDQAQLALARMHVEHNELEDAARRLKDVADGSKDEQLRLVARERLARVQLAQGKADDALKTLEGAKAPAFTARYAEVRGDALLQKGDRAGALAAYREALAATEPGITDTGLLQLKINDLATAEPAQASTATPAKEPAP